ncbi:hypothetical protein ILUMI_27048 [Ignelater luminosus]|uniref:Uncharacterized protein n=1 Tax=Ignelater luminosus TaxID=2038154 RepID=A0A8K0FYC1_IGNLU|nr:hypothetical protein ILUMI_27048 [Ignelater luminosus]
MVPDFPQCTTSVIVEDYIGCKNLIVQALKRRDSQKFLKGVDGLRRDRPRCDLAWDTAIVLRYLKQQDNGCIFLEMLTRKLPICNRPMG